MGGPVRALILVPFYFACGPPAGLGLPAGPGAAAAAVGCEGLKVTAGGLNPRSDGLGFPVLRTVFYLKGGL